MNNYHHKANPFVRRVPAIKTQFYQHLAKFDRLHAFKKHTQITFQGSKIHLVIYKKYTRVHINILKRSLEREYLSCT